MGLDDCRARVTPRPDGRWKITLVRLFGEGWGSDKDRVYLWPRDIEERYDVIATAYSRTEARAQRKASRMLAKLRRAIANTEREDFEVS